MPPSEPMTDEQFTATTAALLRAADALGECDLRAFCDRANDAGQLDGVADEAERDRIRRRMYALMDLANAGGTVLRMVRRHSEVLARIRREAQHPACIVCGKPTRARDTPPMHHRCRPRPARGE